MVLFFICPFSFLLGWFSRFTVLIDTILIVGILVVIAATPLISTGLSSMEGVPAFHSRDFFGIWIWLFSELSTVSQYALIFIVASYYAGKISSWIYLVGGLGADKK